MPLTYEESNALMTDFVFKGRVKVACLKYANSIFIEADSTPAHNTRVRWATSAFQNPDGTAQQIQPPTVMDPAVQELGSAITDENLQPAVEGVVNKIL